MVAAYLRGKAVAQNKKDGLMMAVGLGVAEVEPYLSKVQGQVVVACHNSPESITLSGDSDAMIVIKEALDADKKFARLLSTGGNAYHSHHMKILGMFKAVHISSFMPSECLPSSIIVNLKCRQGLRETSSIPRRCCTHLLTQNPDLRLTTCHIFLLCFR